MSRQFVVAAAQMGPIARDEPRQSAVARMVVMLHQAANSGAKLVVFPELALTTFFPRWLLEGDDLDIFFEEAMPSPATAPLFDAARETGVGFHLGYAERVRENGTLHRYNTSILVDGTGAIVGKYRKIHLPGHFEYEAWRPFQHLEKRYFEKGNLGYPTFDAFGGSIGMMVCNDRRWPEAWRVLGLAGAELVVLGYNTPVHYPPNLKHDHLQDFHNHLSMQAGAYQNGTWVVGVAKAGNEEGCDLIGGSCIIAPTGEIVAKATTLEDEVIFATVDLDRCAEIRDNIFDFAMHREPEEYAVITAPKPQPA